MAYGLLLIRFVFGPTMAAHGAQKLLGWFGGPGLQGTAGMLGKLRFRLAEPMAVLVALAATVHWKNGSSPATAATSSTYASSPPPSASSRPAQAASRSTA